ncbi:thymidine phosphorylase [Coraliomargarita sinensis]|uniref:thymidine phosphorylase n=1 Tax=Coraliomargarita sinensis TaxID=2174842 RepID=A0A317ZGZ2_9BACT|nr:thymidine phosphorylase [Coraliomargarita sinensis]PXA03049.1 thymidine phosphorylase [Coraliomargarita sinensis]
MFAQEIIARKRDGFALSRDEIGQFVDGVVSGAFTDYQSSALLMAIVLRGMSEAETAWLTEAMMHSGRVADLSEISRPKVDKHSTGGVGDKVSLILAPLAAACGLCVPMMSGRGLGHTGGTLDKLDAIPGFRVDLDDAAYRRQLSEAHLALIGQSADMVPADRKLYALRDVTATVESIPLICASILSKKLAEGIDALVLDVKCGRGAFMKTEPEARELAEALVKISRGVGKPTSALITRMDQPLGKAVGNSLEVVEAIDCLKGKGPPDLMEVSYALVAEMLLLGGICQRPDEAEERMEAAITDGRALDAFRELVCAQGGDPAVIEDYGRFPRARERFELCYPGDAPAYLSKLDALAVGEAARLLGAGRAHAESEIDLAVGFVFRKKPGDRLQPGEVMAIIHYNDADKLEAAEARLQTALEYSPDKPEQPGLIIDRLSGV